MLAVIAGDVETRKSVIDLVANLRELGFRRAGSCTIDLFAKLTVNFDSQVALVAEIELCEIDCAAKLCAGRFSTVIRPGRQPEQCGRGIVGAVNQFEAAARTERWRRECQTVAVATCDRGTRRLVDDVDDLVQAELRSRRQAFSQIDLFKNTVDLEAKN